MAGFERYDELLADLGKFTLGKGCLYIKKFEDVEDKKLRKLVKHSAEQIAASSV